MIVDKKILTPTDVASSLNLSTGTVYKYIRAKMLIAYRDRGRRNYQIYEKDVDDFLELLKHAKESSGA